MIRQTAQHVSLSSPSNTG